MFLFLYRYVQDNAWISQLCGFGQALAFHLYLNEINSAPQSRACQELGYSCLPDFMLGKPFDLNHLYDIWTPKLHKAYVRASIVDFCLIMPGFTLMLGSMLLTSAQRLGLSENLAHLVTVAFLSDVAETSLSMYGSIIYPTRMPDMLVRLACVAGQAKWIMCYVAVLVIAAEFMLPRRARNARSY